MPELFIFIATVCVQVYSSPVLYYGKPIGDNKRQCFQTARISTVAVANPGEKIYTVVTDKCKHKWVEKQGIVSIAFDGGGKGERWICYRCGKTKLKKITETWVEE